MFHWRRILTAFFAIACFSTAVSAADGGPQKHSVRIGWGDPLYETAVYHSTSAHIFDYSSGVSGDYLVAERFNYKYSGHVFAEYRYSFSSLFSAGAMLDYEGISWENGIFDRNHKLVQEKPDGHYRNIVIMPTARFSYFRKGPVSVYSGLGAGLLISVASKAEFSPAFYVNAIGVEYGKGHWSGAIDLGALNAMTDLDNIYMLGSRLVSISINYSW